MALSKPAKHLYQFGPFAVDVAERVLWREGRPVALPPKAFDLLLVLVENSGHLLEKDELMQRLWPDTFVEEANLPNTISLLRKALAGDGDHPYIETVPRRGYRFVAAVEEISGGPMEFVAGLNGTPGESVELSLTERARASPIIEEKVETTDAQEAAAVAPFPTPGQPKRHRLFAFGFGLALLAVGAVVGLFYGRKFWENPPPSFQQLTFRRGTVWSARFAPDGQTIIYGAAWDGHPTQPFLTRPESPESRSLGLFDGDILSISPSGEMAISLGRRFKRFWESSGKLARLSLAGGAPREVLDRVNDADWSPDGTSLAVVRRGKRRDRLEFPIGKVLYESQGFIIYPRVSRQGDAIAFLERWSGDESVGIVNLAGEKKTLASGQNNETGLAWSASGEEICFTVAKAGSTGLHAVTPSGNQRLVTLMAGEWKLHDIARDGRALLTRDHKRGEIIGLPPGETSERDLSWLDRSVAIDLSADGRKLLLSKVGAGGGGSEAVYIRQTDGSPAVRLGDGEAKALSPDGKWVIAIQGSAPERLVLLPTGAGEARPLKNGAITDYYEVEWLPDGKQIIFGAIEPGQPLRQYVQDTEGGSPRTTTFRGEIQWAVFLPDGKSYVARGAGRKYYAFHTEGGDPRPVAGLAETDYVIAGSADGRSLFSFQLEGVSGSALATALSRIYKFDLATGRKEVWREIAIPDPAGITIVGPEFPSLLLTPDGGSYVYSYLRVLSDLYLVDGLK